MNYIVQRINVRLMEGVALEPLKHRERHSMAIGVYAINWKSWYFLNEREIDPEKNPQFYYELALRLMQEQGVTP